MGVGFVKVSTRFFANEDALAAKDHRLT